MIKRLVSVTLWMVTLTACSTYYRPVAPHRAESAGARAELVAAEIGPAEGPVSKLRIDTELSLPANLEVNGVRLGLHDEPPCQSGEAGWLEDLAGPPESLHAQAIFSLDTAWEEILTKPNAVDVELRGPGDTEHCLRVPLAKGDPDSDWIVDTDWFITPGFTGLVALGSGSFLGPAAGTSMRLGAWAGHYTRVWLDGGGAVIGRTAINAPSNEEVLVAVLPLALAADVEVARRGDWSVRVHGGYQLWAGVRNPSTPEGKATPIAYHGPRTGIIFNYPLRFEARPGFYLGRRSYALELEVPVSLLFSHAQGTRATLVFGLTASMSAGFW